MEAHVDPLAPIVGVLALQGDFAEHEASLRLQGLRTRQIRSRKDLDGIAAIALPGGESTTMLKLLDVEGLWAPLGSALRSGIPVMATCAGMILIAEVVENPSQRSYGLLPITVVRNGYGRQFHSGTFALQSDVLPAGTTGTFIRGVLSCRGATAVAASCCEPAEAQCAQSQCGAAHSSAPVRCPWRICRVRQHSCAQSVGHTCCGAWQTMRHT